MSANNGRRVTVALPDFTGEAGLSISASGRIATLAYPSTAQKAAQAGAEVEIGDATWIVVRSQSNPDRAGWRSVTLKKAQ